MIDYGLSHRYRHGNGKHVSFESSKNAQFKGNFMFQSKWAFEKIAQVRRDDLISLIYMLIYFVNRKVPWVKDYREDSEEQFRSIKHAKRTMTAG